MNSIHSLPLHLKRSRHPPKKRKISPTAFHAIQRTFIAEAKIAHLADFRKTFTGTIHIIGPQSQLTAEKIDELLAKCAKIFDEMHSGIYTEGAITFFLLHPRPS